MALIAILSNPRSDGNKSRLDRVRDFCAARDDVLHFELNRDGDIAAALDRIAVARPEVLVINGGDGTVQAVLTEMYGEGARWSALPPVAVLPNGKTNLIAKDLGATGDPIRALERVISLARGGVHEQLVTRQLIGLDNGDGKRPTLGMFLAAGALADILLFCRHKLYPLGIPNGLAHFLTAVSGVVSVVTDWSARFLPPKPVEIGLTVGDQKLRGRFQVLMVTTLRTLVLSGKAPEDRDGMLQLLAVERKRSAVLRAIVTAIRGKLGATPIPGVHLKMGDRIVIEDDRAGVILDGEWFAPAPGKPITLQPAARVRFVDLARGVTATDGISDTVTRLAPTPQAAARTAAASLLSDTRQPT